MTNRGFKGRDIISANDFNREEIEYIIQTAENIKKDQLSGGGKYKNILEGFQIGLAFFENSTRTRMSSGVAAKISGADVDGFEGPEGTSLMKSESTHDTIRVLTSYGFDLITMRHKQEGAARWAADVAAMAQKDIYEKQVLVDGKRMPAKRMHIINGGDGSNQHVTQLLLDLFSAKECFGRLEDLDVGLFNDLLYSRVAKSWITAGKIFPGLRFHLVSPEAFAPPKHMIEFMKKNNIEYHLYNDPRDALPKVDFAHIMRFQKERFRDPSEAAQIGETYKINRQMLEEADLREGFKLFHALPIDRIFGEINPDVHYSPWSYYYIEMGNGPKIRIALPALTLGVLGKELGEYQPEIFEQKEADVFVDQPFTTKEHKRDEYITSKIPGGVVIDHIPAGKGEIIKKFLDKYNIEGIKIFAEDLPSGQYHKKDLIKLIGHQLTPEQLSGIALVAPEATINIIEEGKLVRKGKLAVPPRLENLVQCDNLNCITNPEFHEGAPSIFYRESQDPLVLRCHYCETSAPKEQIRLKL